MVDEPSTSDRLALSAWANTYRSLVSVAREELTATDLEALAVAAYLLGDDDVSADAPMAALVAEASDTAKAAMEADVVDSWASWVVDGRVPLVQPMVLATARRL